MFKRRNLKQGTCCLHLGRNKYKIFGRKKGEKIYKIIRWKYNNKIDFKAIDLEDKDFSKTI
jgi:hypothetical protein